MDQIEKFIRKLDKALALKIAKVLLDIAAGNYKIYEFEKMKGHDDLYRIKIGKIRLICRKTGGIYLPIYIGFRGRAYKKF